MARPNEQTIFVDSFSIDHRILFFIDKSVVTTKPLFFVDSWRFLCAVVVVGGFWRQPVEELPICRSVFTIGIFTRQQKADMSIHENEERSSSSSQKGHTTRCKRTGSNEPQNMKPPRENTSFFGNKTLAPRSVMSLVHGYVRLVRVYLEWRRAAFFCSLLATVVPARSNATVGRHGSWS
jgi:hypothetical protein